MKTYTDTERLDWIIFTSAQVCHSNDAEFCWIEYSDRDGAYASKKYFDAPREAIDAAMCGEVYEK